MQNPDLVPQEATSTRRTGIVLKRRPFSMRSAIHSVWRPGPLALSYAEVADSTDNTQRHKARASDTQRMQGA